MDQHQLAVLVALVAVVVVVIAVGYLLMRKRRSQVLRNRFGPEYDRVVKHEGDTTESSARALALTPKKALNEWLHDERAPRLPGSHEVR